MRTLSKVIAGLVLVVPMGAYVAGSLAASADTGQVPRQTIEIRPAGSTPTQGPSGTPTEQPSEDSDDHSGPGRGGEDDDEVEVITPDYDDFDDHDDEHDDDHGDDSGHGPGDDGRHDGDDNSGHGGGDDD